MAPLLKNMTFLRSQTRETNSQYHLDGLVVFGNVLLSPFLIHRCAEDGRSIVWLTA
ncbi:MAG: hypothetical protein AAFV72_17480 [Cyanobacteria bacterium J06635_1]